MAGETQLDYNGQITNRGEFWMYRGDRKTLSFSHIMSADDIVQAYMSVRNRETWNLVLYLTLEDDPTQWSLSDESGEITLLSADTKNLTAGEYTGDIELRASDGEPYTPLVFALSILRDPTSVESSDPVYTWDIRQDLEDDIDAVEADIASLLQAYNHTYLTADAASGATVLTVARALHLDATDTVLVELDNNTYGSHTIDSRDSATQITLTAGLSGAASANNIVRKS